MARLLRLIAASKLLADRQSLAKLYRVENALHENEVEPAVKLSPDLAEMRDLLEAKSFVQTDRH
jgi:hypothetical protein